MVAKAGPQAARWFVEFFTAKNRNPNTRRAYYRAALDFFNWLQKRRLSDLTRIQPVHVAAYSEQLQQRLSKPSVKQHLAAVRTLFDGCIVGQVVPVDPASGSVGG